MFEWVSTANWRKWAATQASSEQSRNAIAPAAVDALTVEMIRQVVVTRRIRSMRNGTASRY